MRKDALAAAIKGRQANLRSSGPNSKDTHIAHVMPQEMVIHPGEISPDLLSAIAKQIDLKQHTVGTTTQKNPVSGLPAFYASDDSDTNRSGGTTGADSSNDGSRDSRGNSGGDSNGSRSDENFSFGIEANERDFVGANFGDINRDIDRSLAWSDTANGSTSAQDYAGKLTSGDVEKFSLAMPNEGIGGFFKDLFGISTKYNPMDSMFDTYATFNPVATAASIFGGPLVGIGLKVADLAGLSPFSAADMKFKLGSAAANEVSFKGVLDGKYDSTGIKGDTTDSKGPKTGKDDSSSDNKDAPKTESSQTKTPESKQTDPVEELLDRLKDGLPLPFPKANRNKVLKPHTLVNNPLQRLFAGMNLGDN